MRLLFILMVSLTFTACFDQATQPKDDVTVTEPDTPVTEPDKKPAKLTVVGEWKQSTEETTETEKIYRNESFEFPPARAREGFVFKEDGTMVMKTINPNDTMKEVTGKYVKKDVTVEITLDDEEKTSISLLTDRLNEGILIKSIAKK